METIGLIILIVIVTTIIVTAVIDEVKYIKFKDRIQIGTQLTITSKYIGDEFDEGYTFVITVLRKGKYQLWVKYSDGSQTGMNMYNLYCDGWKILTKNNL